MPLTPADVHNVAFKKPSIGKRGYDEVLGKLTTEKVGLEKKIQDLRSYEREYRGRLKSWISDQLAQLDDGGSREQQPVAVTSGPGD